MRLDLVYYRIENAKKLDFGDIFSESIELFKKTWIQGFLLQLFTFIIMLPLIIVIYMPLIGMMMTQSQNGTNNSNVYSDFFAGMSIIYILFIIVAIFALSAISFVLNAGFFRMMKKLDFGEQVTTSDFFYFFKAHYFNKTFMIVLATFGISILAVLLCYLPIFYVMIPLSFFNFMFAFNPDLSKGEIVNASFKLGHKKWLITFGLMIVSGLLAEIVGLLMCGIGVLFTAAFVYHPLYFIYKNVIGFKEQHMIDEIETPLE
jgi:hypothetical protein